MDDDVLRKKLVEVWYAAYNEGMRVARGGGGDGRQLEDVDAIMLLIKQDRAVTYEKGRQDYAAEVARTIEKGFSTPTNSEADQGGYIKTDKEK